MTRKHFQIIADALVEANATIEQVKIIAKQLKATNPRFNTDRFILAAMNWEEAHVNQNSRSLFNVGSLQASRQS